MKTTQLTRWFCLLVRRCRLRSAVGTVFAFLSPPLTERAGEAFPCLFRCTVTGIWSSPPPYGTRAQEMLAQWWRETSSGLCGISVLSMGRVFCSDFVVRLLLVSAHFLANRHTTADSGIHHRRRR